MNFEFWNFVPNKKKKKLTLPIGEKIVGIKVPS